MPAPAVPFPDLVRGFLVAAREHHFETTVVAIPRAGGSTVVASNNGETGIAKARAQLLVQEGAIERTAMALHAFRFVEEGKAPELAMDGCTMLGCLDTEVKLPAGTVPAAFVAWETLPDVLKEAHRAVARVVIGAALMGVQPAAKLVSV